MSIYIANTSNTSTFQYWLNRTNELAYQVSSSVVTTDGSGNTNVTVGSAAITGTLTANGISVGDAVQNTTFYSPNSTAVARGYLLSANGSWVPGVSGISNVAVNATANVVIDSYDIGLYTGAEYIINVYNPNKTSMQQTKMFIMNDLSGVYTTEYATLYNNTRFASVSALFNTVGNTVDIYLSSTLSTNVAATVSKILVSK